MCVVPLIGTRHLRIRSTPRDQTRTYVQLTGRAGLVATQMIGPASTSRLGGGGKIRTYPSEEIRTSSQRKLVADGVTTAKTRR